MNRSELNPNRSGTLRRRVCGCKACVAGPRRPILMLVNGKGRMRAEGCTS